MAITITKPKVAEQAEKPEAATTTAANTEPKDMTLEELADAYGSLEDKTKALMLDPAFAKFALVAKELKSRVKDELEPEDTAEIQGEHWLIEVGAANKAPRKVTDVLKIKAFVGEETFAQIAKVNLADVDKYLTPEQVAQVVDDDQGYTETRKLAAKFLG